MPNPQEIPQIATELVEMSREYLRQETLEPAKRLGKQAGMGLGGAIVMAIGAVCLAWGLYYGLTMLLPEGEWWIVLARGLTAIAAAAAAGIVAWRISVDTQ
ncbi:MAG TPA: phage holin family protein [Acidimicrobiia bacterium]